MPLQHAVNNEFYLFCTTSAVVGPVCAIHCSSKNSTQFAVPIVWFSPDKYGNVAACPGPVSEQGPAGHEPGSGRIVRASPYIAAGTASQVHRSNKNAVSVLPRRMSGVFESQ